MREHSRFEKARVIGARALNLMGAPVDIKVPEGIIDPVIIAQMEYDTDAIPIDIVDRENMIIKDIIIRRILDSRGNPTVEAEITSEENEKSTSEELPSLEPQLEHMRMAWPSGSVSKGMIF